MMYDPEKHHRRSLRLEAYDYSQPGAYFVTICTGNRECLFGEIIGDEMRLNLGGRMVERWWRKLPDKFRGIDIDAHVVMPNHVHGIILVAGGDLHVSPNEGGHTGPPLPRIVQWFKTMTTNDYIRKVKEHGWPPFHTRLWQRNYYEHVIRSNKVLNSIRGYVKANPSVWKDDLENTYFTTVKHD